MKSSKIRNLRKREISRGCVVQHNSTGKQHVVAAIEKISRTRRRFHLVGNFPMKQTFGDSDIELLSASTSKSLKELEMSA